MNVTDKISASISNEINEQLRCAFREAFGYYIDEFVSEVRRSVFLVCPDDVVLHEQFSWKDIVFFEAKVMYRHSEDGGLEIVLQTNKYKSKQNGNH